MRRWRKGLAWLAGIVMTGSLVSGAAAADVTTTITLEDNSECTASLTGGTIDLGTWRWNGDSYVRMGDTSANLGGHVTLEAQGNPYGDGACKVTLSASNLTQDGGAGVIEDVFSLHRKFSGNPLTVELKPGVSTVVDVNVPPNLGDLLKDAEPGTYSGTITVLTVEAPGL